MSLNLGDNSVNFKAFEYVNSETAQTLKNSEGKEKSRLHLLTFDGLRGTDRCAVAAERLDSKDAKELGWLDRQLYVLYEQKVGENSTWYKINKNSLEKRLGISCDELDVDKNGVVGSKLNKIVEAKQKDLNELNAIARPQTAFEKRFIRGLAEKGITKEHYRMIIFHSLDDEMEIADSVKDSFEKMARYSILHICYSEKLFGENLKELLSRKNGPILEIDIDHSSYEKILSGKPIPKAILDQLNKPLGLPLGKIEISNAIGEMKDHPFNSKTGLLDIQKIYKDLKAHEKDQITITKHASDGTYIHCEPMKNIPGMTWAKFMKEISEPLKNL